MQTEPENTWDSAESPSHALKKPVANDSTSPAVASGLDQICVRGGYALNGKIRISGAKNAALPLMCAALLTEKTLILSNIPTSLRDIQTLSQLLEAMGCTLESGEQTLSITAKTISDLKAPYDLVRKMRASILVLGPLLARFGEAEVSLPGGCAIGTRPVDLHIDGLKEMGADIVLEEGYIKAHVPNGRLTGTKILFPKVSVGATENLMMAATLAEGTTVLANAAREPEIIDLGECLNAMGARISGLGTEQITIEGVETLNGATHDVVADRIETGTYAIAAAMAGGEILLQNAHLEHIKPLMHVLEQAGVTIEQQGKDILVRRDRMARLRGIDIMTEPYPGFPTDLQAQIMAMLTTCDGAGMVTETIFENRFMHVPELCRMGANITVHGASALIRGVEQLKGAEVMATDLRASVSLILAALVAEGETIINRVYHLDRGYEYIVEKLANCGADIKRVKSQQ